jgi:DNA-binding GntR family transcriptional regulator
VERGADRAPRTLAATALGEIQERILDGEFEPGQRLRVEELAALLDLSPMPVREALQKLEALGFVERIPHRGARVRTLSADDLIDTYASRLVLESLATRRAAERFTPAAAMRATRSLDEYVNVSRRGDRRAARLAHHGFHFAIYEAAGSPWLLHLIRPLFESSERYRAGSMPNRGTIDSRQREHQAILDACVDHDSAAAANAMEVHLDATVKALVRTLGISPAPELQMVEVATYRSDVVTGG